MLHIHLLSELVPRVLTDAAEVDLVKLPLSDLSLQNERHHQKSVPSILPSPSL